MRWVFKYLIAVVLLLILFRFFPVMLLTLAIMCVSLCFKMESKPVVHDPIIPLPPPWTYTYNALVNHQFPDELIHNVLNYQCAGDSNQYADFTAWSTSTK